MWGVDVGGVVDEVEAVSGMWLVMVGVPGGGGIFWACC